MAPRIPSPDGEYFFQPCETEGLGEQAHSSTLDVPFGPENENFAFRQVKNSALMPPRYRRKIEKDRRAPVFLLFFTNGKPNFWPGRRFFGPCGQSLGGKDELPQNGLATLRKPNDDVPPPPPPLWEQTLFFFAHGPPQPRPGGPTRFFLASMPRRPFLFSVSRPPRSLSPPAEPWVPR